MFYMTPPPTPNNRHLQPPREIKSQIKFRSNVAELVNEKSDDAFIYFDATNNFFHRRSSFIKYEIIDAEVVRVSHGKSQILGKSTVRICNVIYLVEANHAPCFT